MRKTQKDKMSMHYATQKACERQIDVVNEFLAFKEAFQEFCECLTEIEKRFRFQDTTIIGITQDKLNIKSAMATTAVEIAGGIRFYATNTNNNALLQKVTITKKGIAYARDFVSTQRCLVLKSLIEEHLTQLAGYGVMPSHLESFATQIAAFEKISMIPRELRDQRKVTTYELNLLFKKTSYILKFKMDPMVMRLRSSHPQFYQDYFNARMIIDSGNRRSKPTAAPEPTASNPTDSPAHSA